MNRRVAIEIKEQGDMFVFKIIFLDTGEIRQKRRSRQWVMERLFMYELKTWNKKGWRKDVLQVERYGHEA